MPKLKTISRIDNLIDRGNFNISIFNPNSILLSFITDVQKKYFIIYTLILNSYPMSYGVLLLFITTSVYILPYLYLEDVGGGGCSKAPILISYYLSLIEK